MRIDSFESKISNIYKANNHSHDCENKGSPINLKGMVLELYKSELCRAWDIKKRLENNAIDISLPRIYSIIRNYKKLKNLNNQLTTTVLENYVNKYINNNGCTYVSGFEIEHVTILGVTDVSSKFYLSGIAIVQNESTESYLWALKQLELASELRDFNYYIFIT
ncbi:hypothetical protein BB559_006862 [Furculomyces boomerangus]|uniref:MULE transposase domain-containing protein n=2 Tax=Harpellales TaxID=61421 RepID=A0A2T9Y084_9FUNG|nr:hypothetical protein BB559_006862 [Furculomyces boomerangus]PWA00806.1 hypothetical protein BB558_003130 [Smittium angustum]